MTQAFNLTADEVKELIPSGTQTYLRNRIAWVCTHLRKALILQTAGKGVTQITERGLEVLKSNPNRIDLKFLKQFPEHMQFMTKRREGSKTTITEETIEENNTPQTPSDMIIEGYKQIRQELADELLEQVKANSSEFFERLVVELLVTMGYGGSIKDAGRAVGKSGDEGIDGIIKEDKLGLDIIYIQAKRWENTVGRPEIQKFAGALQGKRAKKGVFISTSNYSDGALEFAQNLENKIVLIGGEQLAELMIDNNIGVSLESRYEIKRLDSDYFSED